MNAPFFIRIHRKNLDGSLTFEDSGGSLQPLPDEFFDDEYEVGDVLRVEGSEVEIVDRDNWTERFTIAIVVSVSGRRAVVETQIGILDATIPEKLNPAPGNTVRLDSRNLITAIVSETPVRSAPIQIDRDDDFDPASFIEKTSGSNFEWDDFGGFEDIVSQAKDIVEIHLAKRAEYAGLGVTPLRGVIFAGPAGTGKTFLARIMAHNSSATLYVVSAAELGGRLVGESEGRLQAIYDHAAANPLSIVFIDEIDGITHHRGATSGSHADRLVSTFLVNMDGFRSKDTILTIGTTNRIDDIDSALRRPGRFGTEIIFRAPARNDRLAILTTRAEKLKTQGPLSHKLIAELTDGWSAAELEEIWTQAATLTIKAGRSKIWDDHYAIGYERIMMQRKDGETT